MSSREELHLIHRTDILLRTKNPSLKSHQYSRWVITPLLAAAVARSTPSTASRWEDSMARMLSSPEQLGEFYNTLFRSLSENSRPSLPIEAHTLSISSTLRLNGSFPENSRDHASFSLLSLGPLSSKNLVFCNAIDRGNSILYRREASLHEYSYFLGPQQYPFLKPCLHSTSGIGLETCILFAKEGANVLMADISAPALEKASTKLKQLVPSAHKVDTQVRNF